MTCPECDSTNIETVFDPFQDIKKCRECGEYL